MNGVLSVWVRLLVIDSSRYLIAAGGAFLVFWVWGRERWRRRLIAGRYETWPSMRREIAYSASTAVIFSGFGALLVYGTRAGIFRVYDHPGELGWPYFVA
jgi:Delta7-sterol 5-desaturase